MIFRKRKDATGQQSEPEIRQTDEEYAREYELIFNCAFDGPRRLLTTEIHFR